jgi:hypothetical protein
MMNRRTFSKLTALASIGALSRGQELEAEQPPFAAHWAVGSEPEGSPIQLENDEPISLRFFGSPAADLFTREIEESFQGVLKNNFVAKASNGFPAGFVNASPRGQIWGGTMWTRDGGTFMRELVMRGYYEHGALLAECLIGLVEKNAEGFYSFPMFFKGSKPGTVDWPPSMNVTNDLVVPRSGTELDGTTSIIIGMVLLWQRLPDGHPAKNHIREFLFQDASPVNYLKSQLKTQPLVPGSGEFGCGMGCEGEWYNVTQNNLVMISLLAASDMAEETGSHDMAEEYRHMAAGVRDSMGRYLVGKDGGWIWCIDPKTLKPDLAVNDSEYNRGFGGINGVASMYADFLGFEPLASSWEGIQHCESTFQRLYNTPLRKLEFDRYGIWTQFDVLGGGVSTSPAYGQGYAIQTMLLYDKLDMADKAMSWLANATYNPLPGYKLHRASPYYFYERIYSPDAIGKLALEEGCGALNLVNVSEPLKVSRLLLGVDDSTRESVRIIPRLPQSWKGVEARHWPIRTGNGVVRADIHFERKETSAELNIKLAPGQRIDDLKVRMPSRNGYVWREQKQASSVHFVSQ